MDSNVDLGYDPANIITITPESPPEDNVPTPLFTTNIAPVSTGRNDFSNKAPTLMLLQPGQAAGMRTLLVPTSFKRNPQGTQVGSPASNMAATRPDSTSLLGDVHALVNTVNDLKKQIMKPKNKTTGLVRTVLLKPQAHETKPTLSKEYMCNFCDYKCLTYKMLVKHISDQHIFACEFCPYQGFTRSGLITHTIQHHNNQYSQLLGYEALLWNHQTLDYKGLALNFASNPAHKGFKSWTSQINDTHQPVKLTTDPSLAGSHLDGYSTDNSGQTFRNTDKEPYSKVIKASKGVIETTFRCFYCQQTIDAFPLVLIHLKQKHNIIVEFPMNTSNMVNGSSSQTSEKKGKLLHKIIIFCVCERFDSYYFFI